MKHNNTKVKGIHNENYAGSNASNDANSDADFKERLKRIWNSGGEASKNLRIQMRELFSRRKGSNFIPSRDNLLLGDQYAQLENDSDGEDFQKKKPINLNKH